MKRQGLEPGEVPWKPNENLQMHKYIHVITYIVICAYIYIYIYTRYIDINIKIYLCILYIFTSIVLH